jgi:hypothetical protein
MKRTFNNMRPLQPIPENPLNMYGRPFIAEPKMSSAQYAAEMSRKKALVRHKYYRRLRHSRINPIRKVKGRYLYNPKISNGNYASLGPYNHTLNPFYKKPKLTHSANASVNRTAKANASANRTAKATANRTAKANNCKKGWGCSISGGR